MPYSATRCGGRRRSGSASFRCAVASSSFALKPCGRGLVMEVLRYADEVRKAQGFFRDVGDKAPDPELLDLAATLIDKKTAPFDPGEFHDRYVDALHKLIDKKAKAKGKRHPGRRRGAGPAERCERDRPDGCAEEVGDDGQRAAPAGRRPQLARQRHRRKHPRSPERALEMARRDALATYNEKA